MAPLGNGEGFNARTILDELKLSDALSSDLSALRERIVSLTDHQEELEHTIEV